MLGGRTCNTSFMQKRTNYLVTSFEIVEGMAKASNFIFRFPEHGRGV